MRLPSFSAPATSSCSASARLALSITLLLLAGCGDPVTPERIISDSAASSATNSAETLSSENGSSGTAASSATLGSSAAGASSADASSAPWGVCPGKAPLTRVVGYLPSYRVSWMNQGLWGGYTHLVLAFFNPDSAGHFTGSFTEEQMQAIRDSATAHGVKVLASLGGGGNPAHKIWGDLMSSARTAELADSVASLVEQYGLDGVDVDLEYVYDTTGYQTAFDTRYGAVIAAMRTALPGKLLTAATARWVGAKFTDDALAAFDFINSMSYDAKGTWTSPGEHSPMSQSLGDLQYWNITRAVPADKIVLGLPFYGYRWKRVDGALTGTSAVTNAEVHNFYPSHLSSDYFADTVGTQVATISWNSHATIDAKSCLARGYGGAMVWEIGQDAPGDLGALQVIKAHR
jgi:GH18 family chitinase